MRAEVVDDRGDKIPVQVEDNEDGTYDVRFTAHHAATYCLKVLIFDRPIKVRFHIHVLVLNFSFGFKRGAFTSACSY